MVAKMGSDDFFKRAKQVRDLAQYKRKVGNKGPEKPRILIVCEGGKTEPNYFKCFRPANIVVIGLGQNTDSLVREAIRLQNKDDFDQVWCVFDRDNFPAHNFNLAFSLATSNNIQIVYSNEAFELWYFLHFDYLDAGITRHQYIEKLNDIMLKQFSRKYAKNSTEMYDLLLNFQSTAIKNANTLLQNYPNLNPESDKPSTTVHLLVEELNKWK